VARVRRYAIALGVVALATFSVASPSGANSLGEITTQATGGVTPGFTANQRPDGITTGPDGNIWYTIPFAGIGRLNGDGTASEFTSGITGNSIRRITSGPDGNLWFTEFNPPAKIGRITPAGDITEMAVFGTTPNFTNGNVEDIIAGPDGNLWFTKPFNAGGGRIGRITPAGVVTEFTTGLAADAQPRFMTVGPDGQIWFTDDAGGGRIWKTTTDGTITLVATGGVTPGLTAGNYPYEITLGPDGNVWFTQGQGSVGRITPGGEVTEFSDGIAAGADLTGIVSTCGALWVVQSAESDVGSAVLRVMTDGAVTTYADGLGSAANVFSNAVGPDGDVWFTDALDPGRIMKIGTGCTTPVTPIAPAPITITPTFTG
jgi:streptogramin lyase